MRSLGFTCWQDAGCWLGHLSEFLDRVTHGASLDDLTSHLLDLYQDLSAGLIPAARRHAELQIAS